MYSYFSKEKKTAKLYNRAEHTDVTQNILGQEQPAVAQNFANLIQAGNPWQEVTYLFEKLFIFKRLVKETTLLINFFITIFLIICF